MSTFLLLISAGERWSVEFDLNLCTAKLLERVRLVKLHTHTHTYTQTHAINARSHDFCDVANVVIVQRVHGYQCSHVG